MHTGSRFFFSHPTLHLHWPSPVTCRPPESLGLLTRGPTIYQNRLQFLWVQAQGVRGWHVVLLVVCGGVILPHDTIHGHLSNIHITDGENVRATSAYRSTCHPEESRNIKSIVSLRGYSSQRVFWVFDECCASVTVALSAGNLRGAAPAPCNCLAEDAGRLSSCSPGSVKGRPKSIRSAPLFMEDLVVWRCLWRSKVDDLCTLSDQKLSVFFLSIQCPVFGKYIH